MVQGTRLTLFLVNPIGIFVAGKMKFPAGCWGLLTGVLHEPTAVTRAYCCRL